MNKLIRITFDPWVMGGKPCSRGLRVTVGTIIGLLAAGKTAQDIRACCLKGIMIIIGLTGNLGAGKTSVALVTINHE